MTVHHYSGYARPKKPNRANNSFHGKDTAILQYWREGQDTIDIAKRLNTSQAFVANALARIRDDLHEAKAPGGRPPEVDL